MKRKHKLNLCLTARALLDSQHKLDMDSYVCDIDHGTENLPLCDITQDVINECGTTTCFAGYAPSVLQHKKKWYKKHEIDENWEAYIYKAFGIVSGDSDYQFLFTAGWKNSKPQCAARLRVFLENGCDTGLITFTVGEDKYDTLGLRRYLNAKIKEYTKVKQQRIINPDRI